MKKKLGGNYKDKEGFTYCIYYSFSCKEWLSFMSNAEGKYCSHTHYTKEQLLQEIQHLEKIT